MGESAATTTATAPRTGKKLVWLVPGVVAGAMLPLAVLLDRARRGTLGADPVAIAMNQLGLLALIFLLGSLAATPLRIVFNVTWPIRIRRALGLLAFFYALLHFTLYICIDQGLKLSAIVEDVTKRKFITVGAAAFVLLMPLAATSTVWAVKKMGSKRWKLLHKLVYIAAASAAVFAVSCAFFSATRFSQSAISLRARITSA